MDGADTATVPQRDKPRRVTIVVPSDLLLIESRHQSREQRAAIRPATHCQRLATETAVVNQIIGSI